MILRLYSLLILLFGFLGALVAQETASFSARISVSDELKSEFHSEGRMFLFFSKSERVEPRTQTWPNPWSKTHIFAKNIDDMNSDDVFMIQHSDDWSHTSEWKLDNVPQGVYYVQILWDQDKNESRIDAPGNLYSQKERINLNDSKAIELALTDRIEPRSITEHKLVREVTFKSELLSEWWNKPMELKASVLLPRNYDNTKIYPIRYNVAGYGGRYTRINNLLSNEKFMEWWTSDDAPEIINVFLDGEGPFGDSYQMDSENSGPYGQALIKELIPHIESSYRGTTEAKHRFVDGCSTGGWVSLGLQLYYPDFFDGVFSYSPDAIEFEHYQLINIYKDKNAYTNEFGYLRPVMRDQFGEPLLSMKEYVQYENVLGDSDTYLNSGGQFSAHTALYSPKDENNLPKPLFDPTTGAIDTEVAEHWKKYDFMLHAKTNWSTLGPKLQDKIYIWMGDMDNFYLNPATRTFSEYLSSTTNPTSDAEITFSPMAGHCSEFSHKEVLIKIQDKVNAN